MRACQRCRRSARASCCASDNREPAVQQHMRRKRICSGCGRDMARTGPQSPHVWWRRFMASLAVIVTLACLPVVSTSSPAIALVHVPSHPQVGAAPAPQVLSLISVDVLFGCSAADMGLHPAAEHLQTSLEKLDAPHRWSRLRITRTWRHWRHRRLPALLRLLPRHHRLTYLRRTRNCNLVRPDIATSACHALVDKPS